MNKRFIFLRATLALWLPCSAAFAAVHDNRESADRTRLPVADVRPEEISAGETSSAFTDDPIPSPQNFDQRETILLDHRGRSVSATSGLEGVLEDIPDMRSGVIQALGHESNSLPEKLSLWSQFQERIEQALHSEGVPEDTVALSRQFLGEISSSPRVPPEIRTKAASFEQSIAEETPRLREARETAVRIGFAPEQWGLVRESIQRDPPMFESSEGFQRLLEATRALLDRGIIPTAGLALAAARQTDIAQAAENFALRSSQLQTREPNLEDPIDVDLFYSILSRRVDLRDAGYYSYRRRTDAALGLIRSQGLKTQRWVDGGGFKSFRITHRYQPWDVSRVNRSLLQEHRDRIRQAYLETMSLSALDREDLAPVRDEILRFTWAYFKRWPQVESERKDSDNRAVPLTLDDLRKVLKRHATLYGEVPQDEMRQEMTNGGKNLFVALHVVLTSMLGSSDDPKRKQARPAIEDLLYRNMIGYQWTDDIARLELGDESLPEDPSSWEASRIKYALDRLYFIYFDKSQEFQAIKSGKLVPGRVQRRLEQDRGAIKRELALVVPGVTSEEETMEFVPTSGVSSLFAGFCGPDCSKSLAPDRGRLALRALDPHTSFYYAYPLDGDGHRRKAVGYFRLVDALKDGKKVLLVEIVELPGRDSLMPVLLTRLNEEALQRGYSGIAIANHLHPFDESAKEVVRNFTNFDATIHYVRNFEPYRNGEIFKPQFPHPDEMAALDAHLGTVRYFGWTLGDGTYRLLRFDDIKRLKAGNDRLIREPMDPERLKSEGLIRDGNETILRNGSSNQVMPFRELLLPSAHTGLYVPKKQGDLRGFDGLMIFTPGIGATISTAKTVLDVARSFGTNNKNADKTKRTPGPLDNVGDSGKDLRLLSFGLDLTLNGMGEKMPFVLGSAEGMVEVLRHSVLILKALYPNMPIFLAGRSQGGLAVIEYAMHYDDVAGVIAANPSHPDREIVEDSIRRMKRSENVVVDGAPLEKHERSWSAFETFTPSFEAAYSLSKVPVRLLLGEHDPSYLQPRYIEHWREFARAQPALRSLSTFDVPEGLSHNLWNRDERNPVTKRLYEDVLADMARFCAGILWSPMPA